MSRFAPMLLALALTTPAQAQDACAEGFDLCGVCGGDNLCVEDDVGPDDVCVEAIDACGVCGGDGSTCLDCEGVSGGSATIDSCGICGGDDECSVIVPTVQAVAGATVVLSCESETSTGRARWLVCQGVFSDLLPLEPSWEIVGGASGSLAGGSAHGTGVQVYLDLEPRSTAHEGPNQVAIDTPTPVVLDALPLPNGLPGKQSLRGTFELDTTSGKALFEGVVTGR